MDANRTTPSAARIRRVVLRFVVALCVLLPRIAVAQGLMGALIGTVKDDQGGVLPGATVRVSSAALIGGVARLTTNPAVRDRLWFFGGYQYLRDYDSQPGTDQGYPRTYEQDKIFAKATWKLTPRLQLVQSFHDEFWVNPDPPTLVTPFEATRRRSASVPAMTFGHLTHTLSANTVWDVRVGRFVYSEARNPSTGDWTTPSRLDRTTGVTSGAPPQLGGITLIRTTGKATVNPFRPRLFGADHQWKLGGEVERGEQRGANVIPTGVRFEDRSGRLFQAILSAPSNTGGSFITAAGFANDAITGGTG